MTERKRLVLDANILVRAVFGTRVRTLLEAYEDAVVFYAPRLCFDDARKYIPEIALLREFDSTAGLAFLDQLVGLVEILDSNVYAEYAIEARERISSRDAADWPVVACALLLESPIWTEDQDFFGCGVATWTTATIEQYLRTN